MSTRPKLSISEVIDTLGSLEQPIFYINRPSILMLGVERWMPNFHSIRLHNSWGMHTERSFTPSRAPQGNLSHPEAAHWLLCNPEVQQYIARHTPAGFTPKLVIFLHNRETEELCAKLGYEILAPSVALRTQLDSKIFTTELSEACGLRNVPHALATIRTPEELLGVAERAGLGCDLVVQTGYGEGGAGTYFIASERDAVALGGAILGVPLKIMKRVPHRALAMEAAIVPGGVVLGPLLQEIVGHPEVAVHPGSSSGLEYYPDVLGPAQRQQAADIVLRYGERLAELGYRGLYEVDLLHDLDTGELHFGESNPRFSGCAMVTNAATAERWGVPLYALHVLAFLELGHDVDVDAFNETWAQPGTTSEWANLLIRHIDRAPQIAVEAPRTGRYRYMSDGTLEYVAHEPDWYGLRDSDEAFFVSYRGPGDALIHGDDIGTLIVRARYQDHDGNLADSARPLIRALHAQYRTRPMPAHTRLWRGITRRLRRLRSV